MCYFDLIELLQMVADFAQRHSFEVQVKSGSYRLRASLRLLKSIVENKLASAFSTFVSLQWISLATSNAILQQLARATGFAFYSLISRRNAKGNRWGNVVRYYPSAQLFAESNCIDVFAYYPTIREVWTAACPFTFARRIAHCFCVLFYYVVPCRFI